MNYRLILGYLLAAAIGVACRLSGIPLPAPPALVGAIVVLSMTTGYILMDKMLVKNEATQTEHCGGPQI
jgi:XapX domain-containing protein